MLGPNIANYELIAWDVAYFILFNMQLDLIKKAARLVPSLLSAHPHAHPSLT